MDPELNSLIKENLRVSIETNELLRKMHSAQKWGRFFSFMYWAIIIGISVGAYYYLQGPLEQLLSTYTGILNGAENLQKTANSLPDANTINSILEQLKGN